MMQDVSSKFPSAVVEERPMPGTLTPETDSPPIQIWGLSVMDLHHAYWRARGVQCVRPGQQEPIDPAADLYLLLDEHAVVLFDLSHVLEHLIWRAAALTRLRLNHPKSTSTAYSELVEADEEGCVRQISRQYDAGRSYRSINITSRPRMAARWREAADVRAARYSVREFLSTGDFDRQQTKGVWFDLHHPAQCEAYLELLIDQWLDPDRSIEGIEQQQDGVWHPEGQAEPSGAIFVGPIWLGYGQTRADSPCLVGPSWRVDAQAALPASNSVRIRDMVDIESTNAARDAQAGRQRGWYPVAKRGFDILVSATLLLLLLPVFGMIAIAIMLTDGRPVIYKHQRQTRGGRNFYCLKFRTMYRDADRMLQELVEQNLCDGPQVFIENDPRVTPVGRLLRRLQLDELPQLWHVLRGHMSMVGPRPSPDRENQFCPSWREMRLSVRPGMTGLWQLNRTRLPGRDFQEWIRYDIEYVREASFWLDLRICVQTVWVVIFGRKSQ